MNPPLSQQDMESSFLSQSPPQPPLPIPSSQSTGYTLNSRVSPSILLLIIIIAVIFFISGLLHLLVRFLLRPSVRSSDEIEDLTALQGQLQQLFNLHDSGVDQSFIDSLPVFNYKAIVGAKDPFDCAVCLSEFEVDDKLRLLPKCSHAFHMDCIDTWLLSHSTCPICRASVVHDFNQRSSFFSPVVRVLESERESSREVVSNSHLSSTADCSDDDHVQKSGEVVVVVGERDDSDSDSDSDSVSDSGEEEVVEVKLGKFRNVGGGDEGSIENSSSSCAEARRCFSMGSFAYVLNENSSLKVAIASVKKQSLKKQPRLLGHRTAMSECGGCDSRREFNGFEAFKILEKTQSVGDDDQSKSISMSKRDSFSLSKIWLRCDATMESTRRAFSFRLPTCRSPVAAENGGGELELDERCKNLESENDHQSFGRRSLQWVMGRQNKVVHSSFSSNV